MDFSLSEEQTLIQDSFRGLLSQTMTLDKIHACAENSAAMAPDIYRDLQGQGMPGLIVPEEYGGAGLGLLEAAIVAEELGRTVAPVPYLAASVVGPLALKMAGSDAQKAIICPGLPMES